MFLAKNLNTDPYYNLAAEEYFLDHFNGELTLLWRNGPTVVVGKNQNSIEEVDSDFVKKNEIAVVRRLTGGGAVFHDLGNINFTVIQNYDPKLFSDYAHFTEPVCAYLKTLGVSAGLSGRNDLLIDGMKCCGNAQTKRNDKFMHHGCLLFSADVADLSGALTPSKIKLESKSVKSVRSRVTNIASHLPAEMTAEDFFEGLYDYFLLHTEGIEEYKITEADERAIQALSDEKYRTWDWNYGKSPAYTAQKSKKFESGIVDVRLSVKDGRIEQIRIFGDFFGTEDVAGLEACLTGIRHEQEAVQMVLEGMELRSFISGLKNSDLVGLLF